jgi:hypothetical protein
MSTLTIELRDTIGKSVAVDDSAIVVDLADGRTITVPDVVVSKVGSRHGRGAGKLAADR